MNLSKTVSLGLIFSLSSLAQAVTKQEQAAMDLAEVKFYHESGNGFKASNLYKQSMPGYWPFSVDYLILVCMQGKNGEPVTAVNFREGEENNFYYFGDVNGSADSAITMQGYRMKPIRQAIGSYFPLEKSAIVALGRVSAMADATCHSTKNYKKALKALHKAPRP